MIYFAIFDVCHLLTSHLSIRTIIVPLHDKRFMIIFRVRYKRGRDPPQLFYRVSALLGKCDFHRVSVPLGKVNLS